MTVFDGFKALAALPDQGPAEQQMHAVARPAADNGSEDAAHAAPAVVPAQRLVAEAVLAPLDPGDTSSAPPGAASGPDRAEQETGGARDELPAAEALAPTHRGSSRAWSAGAACLAALLAGQAAYAYRVELAADYPGLKPLYTQLCGALGCSVPLPQRPKLINIEASDLQVQDPAHPSVIQLTATLRNHAGHEVGFPALDLVLTNTKEHTLARRIFNPEEYLDAGRKAEAGLAANAEVTVRLVLDTGGLGAAGFRLALLPAPPR